MDKKLSEEINHFLQNLDMKLAYEDYTHAAKFKYAVEELMTGKSTENQIFVLDTLYHIAARKYKGETNLWSIYPLTKWLLNKKNMIESEMANIKKKEYASHKQQVLLLYYTGLLDHIKEFDLNKQDTAKLVSYILNRHEKNTRTFISEIHQGASFEHKDIALTPKNLDFVENIFQKFELEDCIQLVQKDRDKVNKK